jgi:hypothetical protein
MPKSPPRTTIPLNLLVPPEMSAAIRARAAAEDRSICNTSRVLLAFALREIDRKRARVLPAETAGR